MTDHPMLHLLEETAFEWSAEHDDLSRVEPNPFHEATSPNGDRPQWFERASDLLAEPDPGPTPWLVESLIVDQSIALLVGLAKARKTWTMLELAVAVTTGRAAFGEFTVPTPGPVLVVLEESGRAAFHRRLSALARGNTIATEEFADLHYAANRGVRLDEPDWQQRLLDAASAIEPRAIFLDPLVRMKGAGRDENAEKEMGPVLDFMRQLRNESGAAVVFVHHTGHDGKHARGTSDFEGYWESRLKIEKKTATRIEPAHREAEDQPSFAIRFAWDAVTRSVRMMLDVADAEARLRARVADYQVAHPEATANEVAKNVRGRRQDILDAMREGGSGAMGTTGNHPAAANAASGSPGAPLGALGTTLASGSESGSQTREPPVEDTT